MNYELLLAVIASGTKLELSSAWFVEVEEEKKIVKMEPFEVKNIQYLILDCLPFLCG